MNDNLAVRDVLSKSSFFITAQYNSCANIKIERSKIRLSLEALAPMVIAVMSWMGEMGEMSEMDWVSWV